MERIGIRELQQHASRWVRRAARGDSLEVTDRGRPVALLIPWPREEGIDALVAAGRATPGPGHLADIGAPRSRPASAPSASEALRSLRERER